MAKIGVIGTGWGTRVQVPAFQGAGLEVAGLAGRDPEKTKRLAKDLGVRPYDDWRALVTDPEIELVTITTPPSEHREMTLAALDAGKHVLCEKPTALDAHEAEDLLAAAQHRPDQITLIDHELRFLPSWREARGRLREDIGDVRYAEVRYSSPARGDRLREWNWWSDASHGGGIWGAVGSHFVDTFRYFGLEIAAVQALLRTTIAERPFEDSTRKVTSDDFAAVNLRFTSGAIAAIALSAVAAGNDEPAVITLHGENGAMRFTGEEVLLSQKGSPYRRIAGGDLAKVPGNSPGGAYGTGTIHLANALRAALDEGNREALAPAATFEDGLAQQRVLDAARESSAQQGCWMDV